MKSELIFSVGQNGSGGFRRSSTSTNYSTRESSPELTISETKNGTSSSSNSFLNCPSNGHKSTSVSPVPPASFLPLSPEPQKRRTPVPADSPLLSAKAAAAAPSANTSNNAGPESSSPPSRSRAPANPALQKVKSFNRSLRRTRSFRACRERSTDSLSSLHNDELMTPRSLNGSRNALVVPNGHTSHLSQSETDSGNRRQVTLCIRKSTLGRRGWKVMPADDSVNLRNLRPEVIEKVIHRIRELELSGQPVPGQMTLEVS